MAKGRILRGNRADQAAHRAADGKLTGAHKGGSSRGPHLQRTADQEAAAGGLSGAAEQQADAPADLTLSERSIVYWAYPDQLCSSVGGIVCVLCYSIIWAKGEIKQVCKALGVSARKGCKTDMPLFLSFWMKSQLVFQLQAMTL